MEEVVRAFIARRFAAEVGRRPLTADTPLFSGDLIDSFGVLELIAFLDRQFGIDIDPARHELSEFDTIAKICALLASLQQRPAS